MIQQQQHLVRRFVASCCPFCGGGSVVVDLLFIVTPIVRVYNCSMFVVRYFVSILVLQSSRWERERELVTLLCLSSWCLMIVVWLFFTMPRVCPQFVIVVFPDRTYRQKNIKI